jgi:hypothetical protein
MSDFDEAYSNGATAPTTPGQIRPVCTPPSCFIGSYPPVTKAGEQGPFMVNTYFLRPDRRQELAGGVAVSAANYKKKSGC